MANLGFGATLVGSVTGATTNLREVAIGGYDVNIVNYVTLDDRTSKNIKGALTRGPITATIIYDKALYEAFESAAQSEDSETWTLTNEDGDSWAGTGFISSLGEVRQGADDVSIFDITITPDQDWDFTASS